MPDLRTTTEDPIQIHDGLSFVSKQDIAPGDSNVPAYTISGKDNYVIGIERNTPFAPEFIDTTGSKLDESARLTFQKADPQGNPLGSAIIAEANLGQFNYAKMRSDPEYFKTTSKSLLLDEREFLYVYIDVPSGSNDFDASQSRLTIGDAVTQTGKPVFIRRKENLSTAQQSAVNQASSGGGGGGGGGGGN
jgi:hypothetical protein